MTDRYIANRSETLLSEPDSRGQLVHSLRKIIRGCPPATPWKTDFKDKPQGLWTGPTSIAYLFLRLTVTHPELTIEAHGPSYWCERYLDCGSGQLSSAADLNGWGIKNEYLAYNTVKAAATQQDIYIDRIETALQSGFECPEKYNEHLSGRAGTLALLCIIRHWVPRARERLERLMKPLAEYIIGAAPWTFHGHEYIGAAHGTIGILTLLVLSDNAAGVHPVVVSQLERLLDLQAEDGHWYITPDPALGEGDLVHYCHGSPGFVISLLRIRPFVRAEIQRRIDTAVDKGRREVWEKGLLRKEPNLCHGIVGNMMALETWEQRGHFMAHATAERMEEGIDTSQFRAGDDKYGLLWGEGGRAWGWAMIDIQEDMGFPSYTDF